MKISKLFNFMRIKPLLVTLLALLSLSYNIHAQDAERGKKLFGGKCASCHFPHKDMTGPALKGARERWIENSSEENFYKWVNNSSTVIAEGDAYAKSLFNDWNGSIMTATGVTPEEVDDIFAYVEAYVPPVIEKGPEDDEAGEEEASSWFWYLIAALLLVVIGTIGGVKGQLAALARKEEGEDQVGDETIAQSMRRWAWNNRGPVGVGSLILVIAFLVAGLMDLTKIGVFEDYKPEQPIAFNHKLHNDRLGIDCKYCHNSVLKSRHAGIPTTNVCMNCHKTVIEGSTTGKDEISKIHSAAGYDPDTQLYSGDTKPVKWVKVHNLPDHVYFNHSQHVGVGGVDCKQCHGDMAKETVARVMTTKDLNAVEENKIKFTRPTLTMGWCIECHQQSSVDIAGSHIDGAEESEDSYYGIIHTRLLKDQRAYRSYLEDDKISVADLGGLECGKCHY